LEFLLSLTVAIFSAVHAGLRGLPRDFGTSAINRVSKFFAMWSIVVLCGILF